MKRINSDDADVLIYREPVYASWLISAPFYFGAVGVGLYFGTRFLEYHTRSGGNFSPLGLLIIGGVVLFLLFLAIVTPFDWFSRRGCRIDRQEGTVTTEWGLFFLPMITTTVSLKKYSRLSIHGWRQVGERTGTVFRTEYYLDLYAADGNYVRLGRSSDSAELDRMSADIQAFLGDDSHLLDMLAHLIAQQHGV